MHTSGKECIAHWLKKGRFSHDTGNIDWSATGSAMRSLPLGKRRWISKHVSGFCGTGKMMLKWKKREADHCPRCNASHEDHIHICKCTGATSLWDQALSQLAQYLVQLETLPQLAEIIISRSRAWRSDTAPEEFPQLSFRGLAAALETQDSMGWKPFFEGRPAYQWAQLQQVCYEWHKKRRTGKRWVIALIKKLWDIAWDMWMDRNDTLHRQDYDLLHQQMNNDIRTEFQLGPTDLPRDAQSLFTQ